MSESSRAIVAPERVQSGIKRFDFILDGGLLRGNTYVVTGPSGSGKTVFASQICFNHARDAGGRSVYVTLLVESHAKLLRHLSGFEYFRAEDVPERIYYVSGYEELRRRGIAALLASIRSTLRERQATILVVDGLESLEQSGLSPREVREFVHELQGTTTLLDCTTLLLTGAARPVESAIADGIIELSDQLVGPRAVRELTVRKFRGSGYLRGRHEVEIHSGGMVIHPRTEVQFGEPRETATEERMRMPFGVPTLDAMLGGGMPSGSTTALLGAPGAGKTLLGLSFLIDGAKRGQRGIYFGFYEPPPRLCEKAEQVGLPLGKYVRDGSIELIWQPPLEHFMDSLAEQLLEKIRAESHERRRLFIDGIEGFRAAAVYPDRVPRFLSAFTNQLRMLDVTTCISEELELFKPTVDMPNPELANVVESVILLRYVELRSQLFRLLSIMKMRESRYDTAIREFRITDSGIEVASSFDSAEQVLSGMVRLTESRPADVPRRPRARRPAPAAKGPAATKKTSTRPKTGAKGRRR